MKRIGKINKAFYHYVQRENNGSRKFKFKNYLYIEKFFSEIKKYYLKNRVKKELVGILELHKNIVCLKICCIYFIYKNKIVIKK